MTRKLREHEWDAPARPYRGEIVAYPPPGHDDVAALEARVRELEERNERLLEWATERLISPYVRGDHRRDLNHVRATLVPAREKNVSYPSGRTSFPGNSLVKSYEEMTGEQRLAFDAGYVWAERNVEAWWATTAEARVRELEKALEAKDGLLREVVLCLGRERWTNNVGAAHTEIRGLVREALSVLVPVQEETDRG